APPVALDEDRLRGLVALLDVGRPELAPGGAESPGEGLQPERALEAEIDLAVLDEGLPEIERDELDHDLRSRSASALGSPGRRSIAWSGPSGGRALAPGSGATWITRRPAFRAPRTSSIGSSPTCTASAASTPRRSRVRRKISAAGFRTPTSSEKVRTSK